MKKIVVTAFIGLIALTGCNAYSSTATDSENYFGSHYGNVIIVEVENEQEVTCVHLGSHDNVSCNWEEYNARYGIE